MKPQFIVFEGLDGSGTSTQAEKLRASLSQRGILCAVTAEPSSGPVGQMIRQTFKGRLRFHEAADKFDRQLAYLFAADRFDHLHNDVDGVFALLDRGMTVICTRYVPSSFAYHCRTEDDWSQVHRINAEFPAPDLLVYLRNPVEESVKRLETRAALDIYEEVNKLRVAASNYERFVREYDAPLLVLDATETAEKLHTIILDRVAELVDLGEPSEGRQL